MAIKEAEERKILFYRRKKIYWFIFSALLCACGQGDSSIDGEREEAKETDGRQEVFIARGAEAVLTSDTLLNRFAPSWSAEEVLSKLPDAAIKKREAVQNRHNPTQTDTLLSIGNSRSEVRFYRLPERDLLQGATIKEPCLSFGGELAVGKPAGALTQRMPPLSGERYPAGAYCAERGAGAAEPENPFRKRSGAAA